MADSSAGKHVRFVVARPTTPRGRALAASPRKRRAAVTATPHNPVTDALRRTHALAQARQALRRGDFDEAERAIEQARAAGEPDAAFHNVTGILHECRGNIGQAKACYGKAIASAATYPAAQHNMRRLYELDTFGRTNKPVRFGDESGS